VTALSKRRNESGSGTEVNRRAHRCVKRGQSAIELSHVIIPPLREAGVVCVANHHLGEVEACADRWGCLGYGYC
jgi:hypothetical protein